MTPFTWRQSLRGLDVALPWRKAGQAYEETAFQYFLAVERARATRANQPLQLLLVTLEPVAGKPVAIAPWVAAKVFASLRLVLRDTDVMGWYRQGSVASAVLTEPHDASGTGVSVVIERRVDEVLRQRLHARVARTLRLRVVQLGPRTGHA